MQPQIHQSQPGQAHKIQSQQVLKVSHMPQQNTTTQHHQNPPTQQAAPSHLVGTTPLPVYSTLVNLDNNNVSNVEQNMSLDLQDSLPVLSLSQNLTDSLNMFDATPNDLNSDLNTPPVPYSSNI